MQLVKLSLATTLLLATLQAEDYIHVQVLQYNEHNGRASITAPSIELNKDFGTDYTFNGKYTLVSISGASPIFYDETKRMQGTVRGTKRFENRDEVTLGASFSNEYDYRSS